MYSCSDIIGIVAATTVGIVANVQVRITRNHGTLGFYWSKITLVFHREVSIRTRAHRETFTATDLIIYNINVVIHVRNFSVFMNVRKALAKVL